MMREMIVPPPLPPKTRAGNSCLRISTGGGGVGGVGATVFVSPGAGAAPQSHSATGADGGHVVKIKINPEQQRVSSVRINVSSEEMVRGAGGGGGPYFFCSAFPVRSAASSGQCSPSDTLDSGTGSDLDGTPPPPTRQKAVTVTVIGAQHKRQASLSDSAASDNESNISCDSLNSADLEPPPPPAPSPPPPASTAPVATATATAILPQGLLRDIQNRTAKLSPQPEAEPEHKPESQPEVQTETTPDTTPAAALGSVPSPEPVSVVKVTESTYEERRLVEQQRAAAAAADAAATAVPARVGGYLYESDRFYKFHLNEHVSEAAGGAAVAARRPDDEDETFAGYRDLLGGATTGAATIRSAKGTVRGVKNRVRAGIATFLQINSPDKSYREKDAGKVVVYSTTMGIVRGTYHACLKVKQILRTHLVKFEERDVFMSCEYQAEIRDRMRCEHILIPQVYVDGQHIGDVETIERLNESGELRRILKPYKSADACTTCVACGGYRLLPCPVCNGSKKSVHRNHFTTEFVALKCMNCDEVGLVRCSTCS